MHNIINLLKEFYRNNISKYKNLSFSQEGEDRILSRYFEGQSHGFYIDIGAHHPFRFSNTYLFYKEGWKGINIEANPDIFHLFNKYRNQDININQAVGLEGQSLNYYKFHEPALNSFDKEISQKRINEGWKLKEIQALSITPLEHVLDKHLPKNQSIDFMSIDVEGLDLEVLKSNNWEKYRPKIVLVENLGNQCIDQDPIYIFMIGHGYSFLSKTINTLFFKSNNK